MNFEINEVYHVYNRGNHRQTIFFEDPDYLLFLKKLRQQLLPHCDVLAWCLMPNHFHLMIVAKPSGCKKRISGTNLVQELSYRMGILLSSYASAINKKKNVSGSLFQKKSNAKQLGKSEDIIQCIQYVHQNPFSAGIVNEVLASWQYSSFSDYAGLRKGTLCNFEKLYEMTGFDRASFVKDAYTVIDESDIEKFY